MNICSLCWNYNRKLTVPNGTCNHHLIIRNRICWAYGHRHRSHIQACCQPRLNREEEEEEFSLVAGQVNSEKNKSEQLARYSGLSSRVILAHWPAGAEKHHNSRTSKEPRTLESPTTESTGSIMTHQMSLKQERIECDEPEETNPATAGIETLVAAEYTSCTFCLEILAEEIDRTEQCTKMEYVLAISMGSSSEATCCCMCWRMFETFYDFKKSCLTALSKSYANVLKGIENNSDQKALEVSKLGNDSGQVPSSSQTPSSPMNSLRVEVYNATFSNNIRYGIKPFRCQNLGCEEEFYLSKERDEHSTECSAPAPEMVSTEAQSFQQHLSTTSYSEEDNQSHKDSSTGPPHWTLVPQGSLGNKSDFSGELQTLESPTLSNQSVDRNSSDFLQEQEIPLPKDGIQCLKCNGLFRNMTKIRLHKPRCPGGNDERTHSNAGDLESELVCQRCYIRFPTAQRAKIHALRCQKQTVPLIAKEINYVRIVRKMQCPHCPRILAQADYEGHMNEHNGITPFPCQISGCTKTFYSKKQRWRHEETIHNRRTTVCTICGIAVLAGSLYGHRQQHQGRQFECTVCGKRFFRKENLQKHSSVHTREQTFQCETCGKNFKSVNTFQVHQRKHIVKVIIRKDADRR